jgi:hypothetical protein
MVRAVRTHILALFPGREQTYEIVYAPRFRRVIDEFAVPASTPGALLAFPARFSKH